MTGITPVNQPQGANNINKVGQTESIRTEPESIITSPNAVSIPSVGTNDKSVLSNASNIVKIAGSAPEGRFIFDKIKT